MAHRRKGSIALWIAAVASMCWLWPFSEPAWTDTLILKNGRTLEIGNDYWRSHGKIHVRRPEGTFSLPWEMVERLEKTSSQKENLDVQTMRRTFSPSEVAPGAWIEDLRDIGASLGEILDNLDMEPKPLPLPVRDQRRGEMEALLERLERIRRSASPIEDLTMDLERAMEDLKICLERIISTFSSEEEVSLDVMEECVETARRVALFSQ